MTDSDFLKPGSLPFCAGCGHHLVARNTARALARLSLDPLDVVLVTDIGCHGIVDRFFLTHTVHGLHGRAAALGAGIAAGLGRGKVIVFMGDGGASIGIQHLVECASRNFPLSVVVHNNMLYGMTGGQPSAMTPCGFRTAVMPGGKVEPGYDLCRIIHAAGAENVRRISGAGDFSEELAEAFAVPGFSLVEVVESCPSYGIRHNPGRKPADIARDAGLEFGVWQNPGRPVARLSPRADCQSLLELERLTVNWSSPLRGRFSVLVAGSAGGRVQQAAEALARAAVSTGLNASKKGAYPVTVGTGYSAAELILSSEPILHTGVVQPDAAVVVSADGLNYAGKVVQRMAAGQLVIDDGLELPPTGARVWRRPFQKLAGVKDAALLALLFLLRCNPVIPTAALLAAAKSGRGTDLFALLERLDEVRDSAIS
uniref:Thiamine pyrophosphate enzyme TPP-binding domain-containing protein n=1 Tax=candidate division WOR-3 bacterium TaxID=2052148 RepID=A0A7C4GJ73_UNCW3